MGRRIRRRAKKVGLPPGTLVHVGEKRTEPIKITIIDYDETNLEERVAKKVEDCFPFKEKPTVTWINVSGVHDVKIIEKIGKHFEIHPLIMEDIVNTNQRPKLDDLDNYLFCVLRMLSFDETENQIKTEQISLILGANFVILFQEWEGDVFDPVRDRIRNAKGRFRRLGSDYLAYTLIDAVVDSYFIILEKIGDKIETLEDELVSDPKPETLQIIHDLKREMIFLRKSIWPLREVLSGLERGGSSLISDGTVPFLRDVYDHTIQVIDTIESLRDMVSGMLDTYLSSISNRMNEVMKVLTIIATIFIPLTFIAGIYGMNFQYMPELAWRWSYLVIWIVIILVALSMVIYFRKKRWL